MSSLGPGSVVSVRRRGETGFMEIPPQSPASMEVEMQIRQLANKLTGRATSEEDAVEANIIKQSLVNTWLHGFSQILKKMFAYDRAYNTEIWFRVTNNAEGMKIVMDETAYEYDFNLTFNTINNDEQKVIEKLQAVGQIMAQYDRQGQARYDVFLRTFLDAIDPNMASQLIMPAQEATTKEIIETSSDIAKIASGQVVNPPQGANAPLRLQVLQQYLAGSDSIPATDVQERLQTDDNFRARMETYQGQLTFMIQQQQNALTGKLGTSWQCTRICSRLNMARKKSVKLKMGVHKSRKDGLTKKGRDKINRETGSNLKAPQPGGGKGRSPFVPACQRLRVR